MKKAKLIIILVVSLLALVVFLQNTETVETKFLLATIAMPRVILLILMFITGFIAGLIAASYVLKRPRKPAASA
jgi:uncharacterized integral membrane protein